MNETEQKIVLLCAALGVVVISFLIITEGLFITLRGVFEISIRAAILIGVIFVITRMLKRLK